MAGETIERAAIRARVTDIEAAAEMYRRLKEAERIQERIDDADAHFPHLGSRVLPDVGVLLSPRVAGEKLATAMSGWLDEEVASIKQQLAALGYDVNIL